MKKDELKGKAEAIALDDKDLEQVAGGLVFDATGLPECEIGRPWEVLHNNTGEVLSRWSTQWEACEAAKKYNSGSVYDTQLCTIEEVNYLRSHPQIPLGTM